MIEGLKVTVGSVELIALCKSRAEFHETRANYYASQMEALPDADESVPEFSNRSKRPQEMMLERVASHKGQAEELRFIAMHIKPDEHYLLTREDLHTLGIVQRAY